MGNGGLHFGHDTGSRQAFGAVFQITTSGHIIRAVTQIHMFLQT